MDKTEEMRSQQLANEQNGVIAGVTLRGMLESLLLKKDIEKAKKMFACHHDEAMAAIKYYKPELHDIMEREKKELADGGKYETAKLTRNTPEVANITGTFFMFGNPLTLTMGNKPSEAKELQDAFDEFKEFLSDHYFDERMFEARQITGAETECAKIYELFTDEDNIPHIVVRNHSNGNGDMLYPLFNQHGQLVAFGLGYKLRSNTDEFNETEEHFEVYTKHTLYHFVKTGTTELDEWQNVNGFPIDNPFDKIPVIYYNHEVDWKGSEQNLDRLEWVISKHADTVDYFGDPYLLISQDIVANRLAGAKEVGKVIVADDVDKSQFKFIEAPNGGDLVKDHVTELKEDILIDTLNPDLSYKSIMGLGTLSGEAMRRIYVPGYIKRTKFAVKIYNEMIRRELNLVKTILSKYYYMNNSKKASLIERLKIRFSYTDPFVGGIEDNTDQIQLLVAQGAMSLYAAVQNNRFVTDKEAEYNRLWEEKERDMMLQAKVNAAIAAMNKSNTNQEE